MSLELPDAEPPTNVELDRAVGLRLHWPDGTVCEFTLDELRRNCPCATCRGQREQGRVPGPGPGTTVALAALDAELIGRFGMQIRWNDGHDTGIYAWSLLRAWRDG
jgi:DUF971 family protein